MFADGTRNCPGCNRRVPAQAVCVLCGHEPELLRQVSPGGGSDSPRLDRDVERCDVLELIFN